MDTTGIPGPGAVSRLTYSEPCVVWIEQSAVAMVYETLARDLESTAGLATAIPDALDDILGLLDPTATVRDVWTEVEDHTSNLLEFSWSDPPQTCSAERSLTIHRTVQ